MRMQTASSQPGRACNTNTLSHTARLSLCVLPSCVLLLCSSSVCPPTGTVEQALGGKICCLINELSDATEEDDLRDIQDKVDKVGGVEGGRFHLFNLLHVHMSARSA